MDRITTNLLKSFVDEYDLADLSEQDQFERFAAFAMMRRHYSRTFDIDDIIVGGSGDTSIDAVAIVVNNVLVTDTDTIDELAETNGQIDASFIFVQADRGAGFDGSKIGDFSFGVKDFFETSPKIVRNERVQAAAEIADHLYTYSAILTRRPTCTLYYVTTGRWTSDPDLVARRDAAIGDLTELNLFGVVKLNCVGAEELHNAYQQTKNAITRTFEFKERNDLPNAEGINQAFIGYVPFSEFRKLISDESGAEILGSIFYDNVRDWQEYNLVNDSMRETLNSPSRGRFVFMNNGVTIIARSVKPVQSRFTISDYQIVNGCQTSNVLFDQRDVIDDSVYVPLRLIETRDQDVMNDIIEATNSQTSVKPEQYFARMEFTRQLERFFDAIPEEQRIYFERRDGQYDRGEEKKTRVISQTNVIRAFAAMYLELPQQTTRGYANLRERVGADIYGKEHRPEPYYAASYAYYLLESRFRAKSTPVEYKPARYHILLALRLLVDPERPAQMNSREMARRADALSSVLWDSAKADKLFQDAVALIDRATGGNLERDRVRTIGVTNNILTAFGRQPQ